MKTYQLFRNLLVVGILALAAPVLASAQDNYYPGGRYGDNYRYNRYQLKSAIDRVQDRSRDFSRALDRNLDRSRLDGTRREDQINDVAKDFRRAADDLHDRFDDGRSLDRSANQARRLLELGNRIERVVVRRNLDYRAMAEWSRIRQDLRTIGNAYGFRSDF
jgi:hypothetical protein